MQQMCYRTPENMRKEYDNVKAWLDKAMDIPPEEMAAFFDKRADAYDQVMLGHSGEDYDLIIQYMPKNAQSLLDLGCGSGVQLRDVFQQYPDIHVVGIDKCRALMDQCREKYQDRNLQLIEADYFQYPFEMNRYDVVLSTNSLHHFKFDKKVHIYQKIYQALRSAGTFLESDYMAQDDAFQQLNMDYHDRRRAKYNIPDDVFVHIDIPLTVSRQIQLLTLAGFDRVEVLNKPFATESNSVLIRATK